MGQNQMAEEQKKWAFPSRVVGWRNWKVPPNLVAHLQPNVHVVWEVEETYCGLCGEGQEGLNYLYGEGWEGLDYWV